MTLTVKTAAHCFRITLLMLMYYHTKSVWLQKVQRFRRHLLDNSEAVCASFVQHPPPPPHPPHPLSSFGGRGHNEHPWILVHDAHQFNTFQGVRGKSGSEKSLGRQN